MKIILITNHMLHPKEKFLPLTTNRMVPYLVQILMHKNRDGSEILMQPSISMQNCGKRGPSRQHGQRSYRVHTKTFPLAPIKKDKNKRITAEEVHTPLALESTTSFA